MATIQSTIELYDSFSPVLYNVMDAVNLTIASVEHMQQSLGANMDMTSLDGAVESIHRAGAAMRDMDVSAANAAYIQLENTVSNTERYIRDNADEQGRFNQQIRDGTTASNGLMNSIKRIAGIYLGIQGMGNIINLSDSLAQMEARLNLIVDDGGSVDELKQKIFDAAQEARADYMQTADAISKLGTQAGDAFKSNDELIAFTTLLNKEFVNAGTSAVGIDSVMLQLTQSMAAGKLQGEELNAVLDNAAPIVSKIKTYLEEVEGVDASNIKELASEGVLTADVIKNAMFYASDEINQTFDSMPMTFAQVASSIKNNALDEFEPVLQKLNDIANSDRFQSMVDGAVGALAVLGAAATEIIDLMVTGAAFIHDNWAFIGPVVYGVAAAVGMYTVALIANNAVQGISNMLKTIAAIRSVAHGTATAAEAAATVGMTAAQLSFNAALYACPLTWILVGILLIIAAFYIVIAVINKICDTSISATGVIVGAVYLIMAAVTNAKLFVYNVLLGIIEAAKATGHNIKEAFTTSIEGVKAVFYGLAAVALKVISIIAEKLSVLPFITFDAAGLSTAAGAYATEMAAKAKEAAENSIPDFQDVGAAWDKGFNTYEYLNLNDAYNQGYEVGQNLANKLKNIFSPGEDDENDKSKDYSDFLNGLEAINNNTDATAGNTADIADALEITEEDLKYLRDIAEREVIDRTVLKSVTIDMSGMTNKVENMQDLDGIGAYLAKSLRQQMEVSMEGA